MVGLLCLSWRWQIREIKKVVHVSQAGILGKKDKREKKTQWFFIYFYAKIHFTIILIKYIFFKIILKKTTTNFLKKT